MLCDQSWIDPDLDDTNGIQVREQRDMLRLESQILLVQLHIRKSLTVSGPCHLAGPHNSTPFIAVRLFLESSNRRRTFLPEWNPGSDVQACSAEPGWQPQQGVLGLLLSMIFAW